MRRIPSVLPTDCDRTPRQTAADGFGEDEIACFDLAFRGSDRERKWDRGGRGVAVVLHCEHDALHWDTELFGRALDDADIGLMGHDPVDITVREPRFVKGSIGC